MSYPKNLKEEFTLLLEKIILQTPTHQIKYLLNELSTVYYRYVLIGLGWQRASYTAKLTAKEKQDGDAFAATLPLQTTAQLLAAMAKGFLLAHAPQSSQGTYGARLRSLLPLIETEFWYPGNAVLQRRSPDECRPKMRHGRGDWKAFSLMEEKGKPLKYRLKAAKRSAVLLIQLKAFMLFMSDADAADRHFDVLEASTALTYCDCVLLWLGWLCCHDKPALKAKRSNKLTLNGKSALKVKRSDQLTLESLIPKITEEMLEGLSAKERKAAWGTAQTTLEAMIKRYFVFLRTQQKADSPRTRLLKLAALLMTAKYQYAAEVDDKAGYSGIPLIRTLLRLMDKEQKAVASWEKDRRYVADQSRKWPEPPAGETVLEYTQAALLEPLRLECRPRQGTGDFCKGHIIAKSLLLFLVFGEMGLRPPGRQQEPRTYRVILSCPVVRPATVPLAGLYWPQPPDWSREKRHDGSLADNYLYKVYHHDGQFYEQGVWVRDRCKYKTHKYHGKRVSIIDNLVFDDGHCMYDYIERYLCGQWYVGNFRDGQRYDWWDTQLRGCCGKWLSQGRAALCTADTPVSIRVGKSETWVSSYLFVNLQNGQPFTDIQMSELFARNAYRVIGKRITPHTFRYMWATWAVQMELTDPELESLAHEMGLTVKTLRQMYERCSATEKNRPINKAMRKLLGWQVKQGAATNGDRLTPLKEAISKLNAQELEALRKLLGDPPAA